MNKDDIKSKLIKENWDLISSTFDKALKEFKKCKQKGGVDNEWKYNTVIDVLLEEWNRIYPNYVLLPIQEELRKLFFKVQSKEFETEKNISSVIDVFCVWYYNCQYFYIFIEPFNLSEQHEENPRFEINTNNENLLLLEIFASIWDEISSIEDPESGEFWELDLPEFYDTELNLLHFFVSKCWNDVKTITKTTVKAIMNESTGAGEIYYLDENRYLKDEDEWKKLTTHNKI
ncbi:hypothetical protein P8625_05995 [Tenacibaculum tangerinum]|uniref:Uncharacterized protein n=1 Tax=Tenacibaculum tangerinum TaxID=3038772 RepID=A0ABY8L5N4_9FLAO|nr:hypothetical protein [Tenacibaculum tangerinum]WGH76705.1 hypothetical protein P8625_05995 [Tenacibaculum tangerinum]